MRKRTLKRLGAMMLGTTLLLVLIVVPATAQSDLPSPEPSPTVQPTVVEPTPTDATGGEVVTPPSALAFTGSEVTVWMVVAAGLLVIGTGLLYVARRRTRAANK